MSLRGRVRRGLCALFSLLLLVCVILPVAAAAGPTLTTTLTDHAVQRGSKKTVDVWARNAAGDKIRATVKLNGQKVEPTWDDTEKTSYTLVFSKEGENIVTVSASSDGGRKKELTYHITYHKAREGEKIGSAVWSVEAFTIGCGYLIPPAEVPIYEGETAAEQLLRLLHANGFVGYYGGTPKSAFYLAYIADGTVTGEKYNNYQKSGTPAAPQRLGLSPAIPAELVPFLEDTMTFYDPDDYTKNWTGYLGEFAFTNGSGWMYSVNTVFPNVGFADSYLSDGDVVRVQYTLGYGADIGGFGAVGTEIPNVDTQPTGGYFAVADKDQLTRFICAARAAGLLSRTAVKPAYEAALRVMADLSASQKAVDAAAGALDRAVANPGADTSPPADTASAGTAVSGGTGAAGTGTTAGGTTAGDTGAENDPVSAAPAPEGVEASAGRAEDGLQSGSVPEQGLYAGQEAHAPRNHTGLVIGISVLAVAVAAAAVAGAAVACRRKGACASKTDGEERKMDG